MKRAELGVDGNAGFALLGENIQEGEAEFVLIALPLSASRDPNRYFNHEWCEEAARACRMALNKLRNRLGDQEITYYLGASHPNHS